MTPISASDLLDGETVVATDAPDGVLYTHITDGKETLYDSDGCPEGAAPIHFPPYREIDAK